MRLRWPLALFLFITAANVLDAWATMTLIGRGAVEAHPYVRLAMSFGPRAFMAWKIGLSGFCALCLACLAPGHRWAWRALVGLAALFLVLSVLHLYLLSLPR